MTARTDWRRWRRQVHDILEVGGEAHPAGRAVNVFIVVLIFLNAIAFAAETVDDLAARYGPYFHAFNVFSVIVFSVEYVLRVWSAVDIPMLSRLPPWRARLRFALRPIMLIDLFAFLPFYLQWIVPLDLRVLRVLRLFRLLKLVRYSPALQTLGRVIADEYRALLGALLVMLVLLLFASTAIYFLEREAQPDKFGSIPAAAWWALSTLTTVGYGDVVPVTPWGKVVRRHGDAARRLHVRPADRHHRHRLQPGIGRHQFVATWSMVARAPALRHHERERGRRDHQAALHAEPSARGSHRARERCRRRHVSYRERRGGGRPSARGKQTILRTGDFFGEMALLERRRHKHDVVAKSRCRVLVLDAQALSRLTRRHPEILAHIRQVAKTRKEAAEPAEARNRRRKPRVAATARSKQDIPEAL